MTLDEAKSFVIPFGRFKRMPIGKIAETEDGLIYLHDVFDALYESIYSKEDALNLYQSLYRFTIDPETMRKMVVEIRPEDLKRIAEEAQPKGSPWYRSPGAIALPNDEGNC